MEIVIDGWLVNKGSPDMWIFKAVASLQRRRRWWFVLRSGQLPGQYVLEYFQDPSCRKLKGKINLDKCQQVDAGVLSDKKDEFVFALRTTKRAYYLASKTEVEMDRWVSCICSVCGLKREGDDSSLIDKKESPVEPNGELLVNNLTSNSNSKDMYIYSPYIPIFECFTGKPEFYDCPKSDRVCKSSVKSDDSPVFHSISNSNTDSPQTPLENDVFVYDNIRPFALGDNTSKEPYYLNLPLEATPEESSDREEEEMNNSPSGIMAPPPRPPKPSNLGDRKKKISTLQLPLNPPTRDDDSTVEDEYSPSCSIPLNCDMLPKTPTSALSDTVYDFPKVHKDERDRNRNAYSNAPPGLFNSKDSVFNYEYRPALLSYDNSSPSYETKKHPEISPTFRDYANMPPSPLCVNGVPPRVHRDLKPNRKTSFGETAHPPKVLNLAPPPQGRNRAASVPMRETNGLLAGVNSLSPPSSEDEEMLYRKGSDHQLKCIKSEIQYLDLNLDSDSSVQSPKTPEKATIYKTVDFVKTKAFNVMRQNVEAYRKSK